MTVIVAFKYLGETVATVEQWSARQPGKLRIELFGQGGRKVEERDVDDLDQALMIAREWFRSWTRR